MDGDYPSEFWLPVGDGHTLHVATSGDPAGPAAVFLHGGPGSGCQPGHKALFSASAFAVFPDQRGAGRSTPHGRREANTTRHLIDDLEVVRRSLEIDRWLVVGGSWGATLGLAYAEAHPECVTGLVLRSIFLGTAAELQWAFVDAPGRFRPELHAEFVALLAENERTTPLAAYYARILGDHDPVAQRRAAWAWHDTERALSEINPPLTRLDPPIWDDASRPLPATALMEAHYFKHDCFLEPDQLLGDAGRLRGIPGTLIQPRYDLLCPPSTATALAAAWPDAKVVFAEMAGHSMTHPTVTNALKAAVAQHLRA